MYRDTLVELHIEGMGAAPQTIAQKATTVRKALSKSEDSFEKYDQVRVIIDRDTHPRFDDAVSNCLAAGVYVARSNPCFELWLILHFETFDKPGKSSDLQKHLETFC